MENDATTGIDPYCYYHRKYLTNWFKVKVGGGKAAGYRHCYSTFLEFVVNELKIRGENLKMDEEILKAGTTLVAKIFEKLELSIS